MKFTTNFLLLMASCSASLAFQPSITGRLSISSSLPMAKHDKFNSNDVALFWGPIATAVAGWTLASQVAMASTMMVDSSSTTLLQQDAVIIKDSPSVLTAALGGFGGATFETLDFSMPSYDEGSSSSVKKAPPSFNPFGDFQPEIVSGGENLKAADEEKAAAEAEKAEQKAAAEARKAEDRAAKESRRAEEKAAAEAAKAEKAAAEAAKKAEKEARRQDELEKQRAIVERQQAAATAAPAVEEAAPAFEMPEFKAPDIKMPDFKAPEMPSFKAPDMPEFKAPTIPQFSMPKFDYNLDIPKFETPKIGLPSISLPNPFGGGGSSSDDNDAVLAPQDIRDEAAREARQTYLAADAQAKEAEEAARLVREAANEKKRLAGAAKDEACKTRPGGKWICLRNPFTSGF